MSCFPGKMHCYKFLSIDRFDKNNLDSSAYFLSHCHTDHMVGLDSNELTTKLSSHNHVKLYMCEVTKVLLLSDSKYSHLKRHICVLPVEEPKIIKIFDGKMSHEIMVTLLSAGHCPGSVMFLFEGTEGTCLYTGDFRLSKGSAARMTHLHSGAGKKLIHHLYADTTFCIPDANYIPEREICLQNLKNLVKKWISKGKNHIVRLNLSAKYGYEYLYQALYETFKTKIYCARAENYKCLPNVAKVLTSDPTHSQIYACFKKERVKEKDWSQWQATDDQTVVNKKLKFMSITLSTLYFTHAALPEDVQIQISDNIYRLCFSFHSSLSEVCDFVRYIQPMSIHANVIPRSNESFSSVEQRLRDLCGLQNHHKLKTVKEIEYKPIGKLDVRKSTNKKIPHPLVLEGSDSDEEEIFIPPKRKR